MHRLLSLLFPLVLPLTVACGADKGDDTAPVEASPPLSEAQIAGLSMTRVQADVDYLASESLGGRTPQSLGHALARDYILAAMEDAGLVPAGEDGGYTIPFDLDIEERYALDVDGQVVPLTATEGVNLAGLLPGVDPARSHETLVLMAHYDHMGVDASGDAYNGAFDDATAVAALLELARLFQEQEITPARSILFLITDGEESGLNGARDWVNDPTLALDDVVMALSMDPLGRPLLPDADPLLFLGLERCPPLQAKIRELSAFADMDVAFVNRGPIPVFSSDQDTFYEIPTEAPAFWVVSPGMTWYHTVDDTPETIDYTSVLHHLGFLAQLVAYFADDDTRWQDEGEKELSTTDAEDAAALLDVVLASEVLSSDEQEQAEDLRGRFLEAAESGEVGADLEPTYLAAAIFLLLDLTEAHPGEVPPAFPE